MDAWARFPDFYAKWKAFVERAIALDMIMIGWHGKLLPLIQIVMQILYYKILTSAG